MSFSVLLRIVRRVTPKLAEFRRTDTQGATLVSFLDWGRASGSPKETQVQWFQPSVGHIRKCHYSQNLMITVWSKLRVNTQPCCTIDLGSWTIR